MPLFPDSLSQKTSLRAKIKDWTLRFCRVFLYGLGVITFLGICFNVYEAAKLRSPAVFPKETGLKLDLDTVLYESRPTDLMSALTFGESPTVADVIEGLNRAADDPNIKMLFARLTQTNLSLAQIQEVRSALMAFSSKGKKTVLFAPTLGETGGGLSAYYLASAFDEIWLQPTGGVGTAGLFFEAPYLKKALEKIGIRPSFEARYEYKTGADMMGSDKMSAPERKNLTSLLNGFIDQIAADVAFSRKTDFEKTKKILLSGPYNAKEALKLKLVDRVAYGDVLENELEKSLKNAADFFDYTYMTQTAPANGKPFIAYIPATGIIQYGESLFGGDAYSSVMGVGTVSSALREAADDDNVKAVLLRIDSPGGGYTPSDSLWRDILYVKEQKNKPVYCSMSSTAASGGYFISLACDKVYAQPSTVTGSIGVFGGKLVVDGGRTLRFSPRYPQKVLQTSTPELALRETQTEVLALSLRPEEFRTSIDDAVNLQRLSLQQIADFRNSKYVCSVWDRENERISDSPFDRGRKVITFNNILKYNTFPLAEIISDILTMGAEEMRCPVEVEFAVNMDVAPGRKQIFNLLQIRPIIDNQDNRALDWSRIDTSKALIYGEQALGIGMMADIADIIYVKTEAFDSLSTEKIADELLTLNNRMRDEGRPYILVGPGRWGSSDPFLGVPVRWNHISEAKVIVECGIARFEVEPSQGTHFFQNVTSLGVGYLTINPFRGDGIFREEELNAREAYYDGTYLRQVRFERPLWVCIDGRSDKGMVCEAGEAGIPDPDAGEAGEEAE